jgi:hypothetical protein
MSAEHERAVRLAAERYPVWEWMKGPTLVNQELLRRAYVAGYLARAEEERDELR